MPFRNSTRRDFLKQTTQSAATVGLTIPYIFSSQFAAAGPVKSERRRVASIGVETQGTRDATERLTAVEICGGSM